MAKKATTAAPVQEQGAPAQAAPAPGEQDAIKQKAARLAEETRAFLKKLEKNTPNMGLYLFSIAAIARQQGIIDATTQEGERLPAFDVLFAYANLLTEDIRQAIIKPIMDASIKEGYQRGHQQGTKDSQAFTDALLQSMQTGVHAQHQAEYRQGRADALREIQPIIADIVQKTTRHTLDEIARRHKREREKRAGAPAQQARRPGAS